MLALNIAAVCRPEVCSPGCLSLTASTALPITSYLGSWRGAVPLAVPARSLQEVYGRGCPSAAAPQLFERACRLEV